VRLPDDLRRQGFALMFVTHNLGLVPRIAQHVAVLAGAVKYRPPRKYSPGRWRQRPPRSLTS
jgi:ABC-type glutathione transport system ATPase component